jgi:histidinol phosphatase-like PHP family hydrolase
LKVDLHCHSLMSDGVLAPAAVAARAHQNGVELWSLTDHDELSGQAEAREAELKRGVRGDPLVQAVFAKFPGAEIVSVRSREEDLPPSNAELASEEERFYED